MNLSSSLQSRAPVAPRTASACAASGLICAALLAGCASTQLDAQWTDPQQAGASLRGQRVLVACEAAELVLKQLCEDSVAAEVVARGATPVLVQELVNPTGDAYVSAARSTGAAAALVLRVEPASARVGSPISIGIGGFGFGSGGFGGGVGVTVPVGGGQTQYGYVANGRLSRAASGKLMWTGRASAPPSRDAATQLNELAGAVLGGAAKAGFF